jgi:hypothetical protein
LTVELPRPCGRRRKDFMQNAVYKRMKAYVLKIVLQAIPTRVP